MEPLHYPVKITVYTQKLKKTNLKLCMHIVGHCFNLVLVDLLGHKNHVVFYFFGCIQLIFNFIEGSPIRHSTLEKLFELTKKK